MTMKFKKMIIYVNFMITYVNITDGQTINISKVRNLIKVIGQS